jgi:hypothetical protein
VGPYRTGKEVEKVETPTFFQQVSAAKPYKKAAWGMTMISVPTTALLASSGVTFSTASVAFVVGLSMTVGIVCSVIASAVTWVED